jgi:membrane protein DedA with SNARE-associated domain
LQGIFFIWTAILVASQSMGCSHRAPIQTAIDRFIGGIAAAVNYNSQLADMADTLDGHRSESLELPAADHRITGAGKWLSSLPVEPVQGKSLVWVVLLLAAATLISEDLTCIGAGLLVARGTIGLVPAVGASFSGIFLGDILLFLAGRFIGRPALKIPPFKWLVKEVDIQRTSDWFSAKGPAIIFTSRFMPGLRLPTYFAAGVLRTRFRQFALYFAVAVAIWTPLLVGLSAVVGTRMFAYYDLFGRYALLTLIATVGLLWAAARVLAPLFSHRGRRLLLSFFRRVTRWEFWPPVVFYLPVVFYYAYLSLRFRSLTLFTACNPGIPEGGFREESKSQILNHLQGCAHLLARYRLISGRETASEKIHQAKDFLNRFDLETPVVFKPDVGQRGEGVAIVRSEQQLERHLGEANTDQIIQEYVEGREFGIFYYRYPDADTGRIFSITDKRLLKLTGDGHSTLEQLILDDDRALCMAPFHLKRHQDKLFTILQKGEAFELVEVGTHCRGALFLDGNALWTPELEAAFDRLSKSFEGFYFGRYDVITPSVEDLRKGRNFKIVELNGVTSEATHIYSPGTSLWRAYGVLLRQWRLAFEIGDINRGRGHKPATLRKMLGLLTRLITGQQPPPAEAIE